MIFTAPNHRYGISVFEELDEKYFEMMLQMEIRYKTAFYIPLCVFKCLEGKKCDKL